MPDINDLITGLNNVLASMSKFPDLGDWGTPVDYSIMVRQDQPPGSGSSQYKIEDLPVPANTYVARLAGDIVTRTFAQVLSDIGAAASATAVTAAAVIADNAIVRGDGGVRGVQASGLTIDDTNNLATPGTVDGRDLSVDGTKLDGIEAGANLYVHPDHTGDVTSIADGATTIANNAVDNSKLADMVQATIKGRASGAGTGDPVDLTAAQTRTIINVEDGADVTDAANVNAAGAVMNTDITGNGLVVRTGAGAYTNRSLAAGAGIDVTNADGTAGNPTAAVQAGQRTRPHLIRIDDPSTADDEILCYVPVAATVVKVRSMVVGGTSVAFNIEVRALTTPFTAGTDINKSGGGEFTATTTMAQDDAQTTAIAAQKWLVVDVSAVTGVVTKLLICIELTYD